MPKFHSLKNSAEEEAACWVDPGDAMIVGVTDKESAMVKKIGFFTVTDFIQIKYQHLFLNIR